MASGHFFPQLLPLLSPSLSEPWSHLASASCCSSPPLIQRSCPCPAQTTWSNVHRGLSSHWAQILLWVDLLMPHMRLRFILWGSLMAPATDESSELSLFAETSDGFALDSPTLSFFVSTLSPESPALPTALCCVAGLSVNPLDWRAVASVVWSFGLQSIHLLFFLLKLPRQLMFRTMPPWSQPILW